MIIQGVNIAEEFFINKEHLLCLSKVMNGNGNIISTNLEKNIVEEF